MDNLEPFFENQDTFLNFQKRAGEAPSGTPANVAECGINIHEYL